MLLQRQASWTGHELQPTVDDTPAPVLVCKVGRTNFRACAKNGHLIRDDMGACGDEIASIGKSRVRPLSTERGIHWRHC